jgi:hypothetical protein
VAIAVVAWLLPGFLVAATAGLPGGLLATLPLQVAAVIALALAPRIAWAAAGGAAAVIFALLPIVAVLAALGAAVVPGAPPSPAALALGALAWLGGAALVGSGRVAPYPWVPGR